MSSTALTIIAASDSKSEAEKILVSIASMLGTTFVNMMGLECIINAVRARLPQARAKNKLLRELNLQEARILKYHSELDSDLSLADAIQLLDSTHPLRKTPIPVLLIGWSSEYILKLSCVFAMTFCSVIVTNGAKKALIKLADIPESAALAIGLLSMLPTLGLGAFTAWDSMGGPIARHISNYAQVGNSVYDRSKKLIALFVFFSMLIACRSGAAVKTLALKQPFFAKFATAGNASATIFNMYFSFLSLMSWFNLIAENCCTAKQPDAIQLSLAMARLNEAKKEIDGAKTRNELQTAENRYRLHINKQEENADRAEGLTLQIQ